LIDILQIIQVHNMGDRIRDKNKIDQL